MRQVQRIIKNARARGQKTLSEYDSKRLLKAYGIPVSREALVENLAQARKAAKALGYPVVLKACSPDATHKTELGLVAVNLANDRQLSDAFKMLQKRAGRHYDGAFLVQEMVKGDREIMMGMIRDDQFGPSIMFGLGGIFTEVLEDVVFRVAPLRKAEARRMVREIRGHKILDAIRGMKAVDLDVLAGSLVGLGALAAENEAIKEIDINPLIIQGDKPIAVDALVVLGD